MSSDRYIPPWGVVVLHIGAGRESREGCITCYQGNTTVEKDMIYCLGNGLY